MANYLAILGNMKSYSYRRRIPKDVVPIFGKQFFVLSLKTSHKGYASALAIKVDKLFERNIKLARAGKPIEHIQLRNDSSEILTRRERAEKIIFDLIGQTIDYSDLPPETYDGIEDELLHLHSPTEPTTPVLEEDSLYTVTADKEQVIKDALGLMQGKTIEENFSITEYLTHYFRIKGKIDDKHFRKQGDTALKDWLAFKPSNPRIKSISRRMVYEFVDFYLTTLKLSPATAERRITAIKSAINLVNDQYELTQDNPFLRIGIKDAKKHKPKPDPTTEQLSPILEDARHNDDVHILTQLLLNTGLRVSEAAGLLWSDIKEDSEGDAYLALRPHPHRRLKSDSSERDIPLLGVSLKALRDKQRASQSKSIFIFPRWNKADVTNGNSASASVAKRFDITSHTFRHYLSSRLKEAECPEYIIRAIQGHADKSIFDHYGYNQLFNNKKKWLNKVALK